MVVVGAARIVPAHAGVGRTQVGRGVWGGYATGARRDDGGARRVGVDWRAVRCRCCHGRRWAVKGGMQGGCCGC